MPTRLQFSRYGGKKLPPGTKLVTRPGKWGNLISRPKDRSIAAHQAAVDQYAAWAYAPEQATWRLRVQAQLGGFDLACACSVGKPCHADVLLRIANGLECDCGAKVAPEAVEAGFERCMVCTLHSEEE